VRLIADGILLVGGRKNLAALETHPNFDIRHSLPLWLINS
jgi:hypothetical protein